MSTIEVMRQALEALDNSVDLVQAEFATDWRHGMPTRVAQLNSLRRMAEDHASAITALRAEIERLEATPGPTCQTFGEGIAVPCAECNTVLVDSQELAALRAKAERLEAVEPVAWGRIYEGELCDIICPSEHAREPGSYTVPLYTAPIAPSIPALTDVELVRGNIDCGRLPWEFVRWAYALAAARAGAEVKGAKE